VYDRAAGVDGDYQCNVFLTLIGPLLEFKLWIVYAVA